MSVEKDVRKTQRTQAITLIMVFVLVLVLLQLWLLTAAMDEFLAGHGGLALPTFLASCITFGINLWLLRYVNRIDE